MTSPADSDDERSKRIERILKDLAGMEDMAARLAAEVRQKVASIGKDLADLSRSPSGTAGPKATGVLSTPVTRVDQDREKGATEATHDRLGSPNVSADDEQTLASNEVAVTHDAMSANAEEIANAEHALGADENGTPG
jgi:hypothetical protein